MLLVASFPENDRTLLQVREQVSDWNQLNIESRQDRYLIYYTGDSKEEIINLTTVLLGTQAEIKIYS